MYPASFLGLSAAAILGLRTRRGLITDKVGADLLGSQTLGAYFLRSMLVSLANFFGP